MARVLSSLFVLLFIILFTSSLSCPLTYDVVSLGAKPDGKTDSSQAFLHAWSKACDSSEASTIYVPKGRFLLRNVEFKGQCKNANIVIRIDGTLVAPADYNIIAEAQNWLFFDHVNGVSIKGGTLDGRGTGLWSCKMASNKDCPSGATTMHFSNSNNIRISGLTSINSQKFHIVINGCQNVKLKGVKISASGNSPNTDGIHVQSSNEVTILNSKIQTGDDCVSIGPGATNLLIKNIACGPGHGISIGSLGKQSQEAGVQNVTVKIVTFKRTQNGVRIKSWGRPSSGFARNILFKDIVMNNVKNPIIIDQNYCPDDKNCPGQASGVQINDVTYQNIYGTSATEVGVKFDCSSTNPCSGVSLQNVKLTYNDQPAVASCSHAHGSASGFVQPTSSGCLLR